MTARGGTRVRGATFFARAANRAGRREFNRGLCSCRSRSHPVCVAASSEGFPNAPASSASSPCLPSARCYVRSSQCRRTRRRAQSHQPGDVREDAVSREPSLGTGQRRSACGSNAKARPPAASSSRIAAGAMSTFAPIGNRAEMLRIRNEPSRGVYIDALFYYMVDYDLDGLIDVGSTTQDRGAREAEPHADRPCHRVLLSQHEARRPVPGQLPEDVR